MALPSRKAANTSPPPASKIPRKRGLFWRIHMTLDLHGRTAFVTGAASGIGLGITRSLVAAGMNVMLSDIDPVALEETGRSFSENKKIKTCVVDVSDIDSVRYGANQTIDAFGDVHVLVNNAGVVGSGEPIEHVSRQGWRWLVDVNVFGVINGIEIFLPLIRRNGDGGHVVNMSSIAGLQTRPDQQQAPYSMTKFAVVALSEALEVELADSGIGVSVVCPARVNTKLYASGTHRPQRFGGAYVEEVKPETIELFERDGMSPDRVGDRVVWAIQHGEFYVLTHSSTRILLERRHKRLMDAIDRTTEFDLSFLDQSKSR